MSTSYDAASDVKRAIEAVGSIAIDWSELEFVSNRLFEQYLEGVDEASVQIVRNEIHTRGVWNACKYMAMAVSDYRVSDVTTKLINLIDNDLRPIRNDFVHGYFDTIDEPIFEFQKTRLKRTPFKPIEMSFSYQSNKILDHYELVHQAIKMSSFAMYDLAIIQSKVSGGDQNENSLANAESVTDHIAELIAEYKSLTKSSEEVAPKPSEGTTP